MSTRDSSLSHTYTHTHTHTNVHSHVLGEKKFLCLKRTWQEGETRASGVSRGAGCLAAGFGISGLR
jgi:hypothetical protein